MTITDLRIAIKYWADSFDISDEHLAHCKGTCCLNSDRTVNALVEYLADNFTLEGQ